jgi:putative spermidine/putrescine transport system permease protein
MASQLDRLAHTDDNSRMRPIANTDPTHHKPTTGRGRTFRGSGVPGIAHGVLLLPPLALLAILFFYPLGSAIESSLGLGADSYREALSNPLLDRAAVNTLVISASTTLISVVAGYLCAAALWRSGPIMRMVLAGFVLLPFWTGVLVKNFAWAVLLQDNGVINDVLGEVGLGPVSFLHTRSAVIIGMAHYVLPYAVLPIFASMISIDRRLERSAMSLGASRWGVLRHVILPLTLPGVYAGALLSFIICTGFYITPVVLGGPRDLMVGNLVGYYAFTRLDFGIAAALSLLITLAVSLLVVLYQRLPQQTQYGSTT